MNIRSMLHRLSGVVLAAALALPLSALAYGPTVPDGFPDVDPGKTLVGVQTADVDSLVLSYSVPLYVTLAVTNQDGTAAVLAPNDYRMINNSLTSENMPAPIAVTGIAVEGIKGRAWKLTPSPKAAQSGQPSEISLTLGGVSLPEMGTAGTPTVDADIKVKENTFYKPPSSSGKIGTYQHIQDKSKGGTPIPIVGGLAPAFTVDQDVAAVPQFRIHYTVSLLDQADRPIGMFYDGPDPTKGSPGGGTP